MSVFNLRKRISSSIGICVVVLFCLAAQVSASPAEPHATPGAGDLFFSQLLYNPNSCGDDPGNGEFVEICNPNNVSMDIASCTFRNTDHGLAVNHWTYTFPASASVPAATCIHLCGGDTSGQPSATLNAAIGCEFTMTASGATTFFSNSSGNDLYLTCGATLIDFAGMSDTGEVNGEGVAANLSSNALCSSFATANDTSWDDVSAIPNPPGTTTICDGDLIRGGATGALPCSAPAAVTLADFNAIQQGEQVVVSWETATELNNRGFNLYRGVSPDAWDRQLNSTLIPSQAQGSAGGFLYTWDDQTDLAAGQTYWYWLQDMDVNGHTTLHGPISVVYTAPTAVRVVQVGSTSSAQPPTSAVWALLLPWLGAALWLARRRTAH